MKTYILAIFCFFFGILLNAQNEIPEPGLDTKDNVHVLEFTPDKKVEKILSVYMAGETEAKPIKLWAKGTDLIQKVMVSVYTADKDSGVKVSIVKDSWEDSNISGYTKGGVFQEGFDTAGTFGIVITSDKPNIAFQLAVWTSGEVKPFMGKLYIPASQYAAMHGVQVGNTQLNNQQNQNSTSKDDNTLMYVLIGVLVFIAALLVLLVFKKKSSKVSAIIVFLCLGHQVTHADVRPSTGDVFNAGLSYFVDNVDNIRNAGQFARDLSDQIQRELSPSDRDAIPQPDSAAGPRLPSSCIPVRYGGTQGSSDDMSESDCQCLDDAYLELNDRRFYFEKLRIIYSTTMKSINAKMALADTASNVHAVSGLAWQSQKMIILKKSIPELNKAYDDKYAQMVQGLEETLLKIDACEAEMGFQNWYNHAGFIYYQFMVDKYKRE